MKIVVRLFSTLTLIITILAMIAAGIFVIPRIFGYMPYIVLSGSMAPEIPAGSVAYINQKNTDAEIGSVIAYRVDADSEVGTGDGQMAQASEGTLVTHRVVDINEDGTLLTKGDANDVVDLIPVRRGQIVGRYAFHIPYIGEYMAKVGPRMMLMVLGGLLALNLASALMSWAWSDNGKENEAA